jgi:hypothetical protein
VTVKSRGSGSTYYATTDDTDVACRISPMRPEEIQALSYEMERTPTHSLTASTDDASTLTIGKLLIVTSRRMGDTWQSVTGGDEYIIEQVDYAYGAQAGPSHIYGRLAKATGSK